MADAPTRLRVLSVAHTAVSRTAGRRRYDALAADPSLSLRLIVPRRWHEFGRWLEAETGDDDKLDVCPLPIWFPRAGPAHWYLHHYPGLGAAIREYQPDVLHLWEEPWSLVALKGAQLAQRQGAALVLEVDQNILKRLPPPFEQIRRYVLARTDLILARSDQAADVVRACGYHGPALPIGYGVDEAIFHPGDPAPAQGLPLRLGFVGRLVKEKGLDDVLDAMERATSVIELAILGEGPHERALRRRAATPALAGRVTFHPWTAPTGVAAFIRSQHVLILPTRTTRAVREQFGRVIIEAQACGVPVVGSTSGAIPDVIGHGGWICPERDPNSLAALLDRIAGSPAEREARAEAGLANVTTRFTHHAVAAALLRAWRQAAHLRAPPEARVSPRRLAIPSAAQ